MHYQRKDFSTAFDCIERSAMACIRRANDPRALLLRYEDGFTDDPTIAERLANAMGYALSAADYGRIFAETRREVVDAYIAELNRSGEVLHQLSGDDFLDPVTHWHKHHAGRTGRVGAWREGLDPDEVKVIEDSFADRMAPWGYSFN
jgi:hypothetical protein